jgi:hypothetical protein
MARAAAKTRQKVCLVITPLDPMQQGLSGALLAWAGHLCTVCPHPSLHVRTASRGDARAVLLQAHLRHAAPRRVDDPPSRHECRRVWLFCMPWLCTRPYACTFMHALCVLTLFAYGCTLIDTHCHTRAWTNSHASVGWEMSGRQVPRTTDCAQRGGSMSHPLCGVQGELHAAMHDIQA